MSAAAVVVAAVFAAAVAFAPSPQELAHRDAVTAIEMVAADAGPKTLRRAADRLEGAGAEPADGAADLTQLWRSRARTADGRRAFPGLPTLRGRALGPGYRQDRAEPNRPRAFEQVFLAGRLALVSVVPDPRAPLRLEVLDDEGRAVCRANVQASATCRWTPPWTTRYVIRVENAGTGSAAFSLVVN